MFQNFANYLLGSVTNQYDQHEEQNEQGAHLANSGSSNRSQQLAIQEENNDDWVFVDRDSEGNSSDASSVQSLDLDCLPEAPRAMEESWFLTPPPCFTSAGPIHMQTSPLENLLIEHPSMSVYRKHFGGSELHLEQFEAVYAIDEAIPEEEDDKAEVQQQVSQRTHRSASNATTLLQRQQQQTRSKHHAQKVQMQKAGEAIKRAHLDRHNKARELNGRNRKLRRGERSQGANGSRANNNRKC